MEISKFQRVRISDIEADLEPVDMVTIDASGVLRRSLIDGNIDGGNATGIYLASQRADGGNATN